MAMAAVKPVHIIEDDEELFNGPQSSSPTPEQEFELEDLMEVEGNNTTTTTISTIPTNSISTLQNSVDFFEESLNETRLFARQVVCNEADRVQKRLLQFQQRQAEDEMMLGNASNHSTTSTSTAEAMEEEMEAPIVEASTTTTTTTAPAVEPAKDAAAPKATKGKKRRRKTRARQVSGADKHQAQVLQQEASRSHKMMYLLQQMEHIQAQLLDEMNACADDADLRGDYDDL